MSFRSSSLVLVAVANLLMSGCAMVKAPSNASPMAPSPSEMTAVYTSTPVVIDGNLDESVWKTAPAYRLMATPSAASVQRLPLKEAGVVRLAWDEKYLYVAAEFCDSDVVAEGTTDNLHHYLLGDVCEVFLKPEDQSWYWELYATPAGRQSTFFFPGPGRWLPSCLQKDAPLTVAAQTQGTLNFWQDRDRGWTAEMAIPLKMLTAHGEQFGPGVPWRILVGRYNYSRYLPATELSSYPALSKADFHRIEEYAYLRLQR